MVLDVLNAIMDKPRTVNQLTTCIDANHQTIRYGLSALEKSGLAKKEVGGDAGKGIKPYVWAAKVRKP